MKRFLPAGVAAVVLGLLGFLSLSTSSHWIGGFQEREYQVTFRDPGGRPVKGVELGVENKDGPCPLQNLLPMEMSLTPPTSDKKGVLTFRNRSVRFGGTCRHLFFVIPVGSCAPPTFYCRFLYRGEVVYRVPFNRLYGELTRTRETAPKVRHRRTGLDEKEHEDEFLVLKKTVVIQVPEP